MDPVTAGLIGSAVIGAGASIFGSHKANKANKASARDRKSVV